MTVVTVKFEELYEPWEILDEIPPAGFPQRMDVPDDLLARFKEAKAAMAQVWQEMRGLPRWVA